MRVTDATSSVVNTGMVSDRVTTSTGRRLSWASAHQIFALPRQVCDHHTSSAIIDAVASSTQAISASVWGARR